ncbi:MAG: site-specific integrase [Alphaproteobacteria bacterium]|nr:site-specific integrase [Alphaproteobacteria bacterium]
MKDGRKLTKWVVESIKPDKSEELLVWDSEIRGFGVRVYPTGRKTYFVQYRNEFFRTRRKKIGVHGAVTAEQAREIAKGLLGDVAKGGDPSQEVQARRIKPSFADLAKEYLEFYAKTNKRPKSYREDEKMLEGIILKRWADKKVEELTAQDIQHLHHELKDTPYMANRVRALLSKMLNIAIQWKWRTDNPVNGVQKYQEQKRNRWLDEVELEKLWGSLESYHNQNVANAIWLLVLTGSRRGEVLSATWDQFDLEKGIWTKPAHTTKQNRMEHLPLSSQVITLLKGMKEISRDDHLFPGRVHGKSLQDIKKAWKTIQTKAGLQNVRLHDLRHTHASHLVSSGLSLSIVGKLLGHTQASTTQRYAHLADAPLRQAAEFFGNKAQAISSRSNKAGRASS